MREGAAAQGRFAWISAGSSAKIGQFFVCGGAEVVGRPRYDCDTSPYWCSEDDYRRRDKRFGEFVEAGAAYRIEDPDTPRPWLNYFANRKFGAVVTPRGRGFTWYRSLLLRVTRYEHPVDYLPREFPYGRTITVTDLATGATRDLLAEAEGLVCTHRPGWSVVEGRLAGLEFSVTFFVPLDDACEVWLLDLLNASAAPRELRVGFEQVWAFARFGIHTAEKGIPCLSTPGRDLEIRTEPGAVFARTANPELPFPMWGLFLCPQADRVLCEPREEIQPDGRRFVYHRCRLEAPLALSAGQRASLQVVSGAEATAAAFEALRQIYRRPESGPTELGRVRAQWRIWQEHPFCEVPDADLQRFLNVWLKNQLQVTFHFVRAGHVGYRDSLQDLWGYTLLDPTAARSRLLEVLAHQYPDGRAPRNFSAFGEGVCDERRFMDSPVWIARALSDLVRETGEFSLLEERVPFVGGESGTVGEHLQRALDCLYRQRGPHGMCLIGDGDWNDALEGMGRHGPAESVWLTIALYDALQRAGELFEAVGAAGPAAEAWGRAEELRRAVNEEAWDGSWYIYAFTGSGVPVGSHRNREGRIHLNAQTWAVFTGLADAERARAAMAAVEEHLDTPLGPALLAPPYVQEDPEVGRIARLEPGTFENGSIYHHAVAFKVAADLALGEHDRAYRTLMNLLPTNPDNFDCRRTSEPYCLGNFYCGPGHPRFGQNFFTWFTGTAAWLLRVGFDEMLGVRAGYHGLEIRPRVPSTWPAYAVCRRYRGCVYRIEFVRARSWEERRILVDNRRLEGNVVPVQRKDVCSVKVFF